jgi:hypothetical protein
MVKNWVMTVVKLKKSVLIVFWLSKIQKKKKLCVSNYSMHELFICEAHLGDSMRYFGIVKNSNICISIFICLR